MHDDDRTALELDAYARGAAAARTDLELDAYVRGIAAAVRELEDDGVTVDADGVEHHGLAALWADALEIVPTGERGPDGWTLTGATVLLAYGGPTVRAYVHDDGVRVVGSWGSDRVEHWADAPGEAGALLELLDA